MTLVFLKHCCFSTNQNAIREVLTVFSRLPSWRWLQANPPLQISYYNHLWVAVWFQIKVKIKVYLILYSLHKEQQPWVQMKNNFLSQSGQLCYGYTMTKGPYRGSPTYTKITNTVSTNTFFGLCTCKWGN